MIKKENIIPFTVDMHPDDGFMENDELCKMCIESWKDYFGDKVKIYTPDDDIVKEALKDPDVSEYITILKEVYKKNYYKALESDVIRLYILSHKKNHLYFDSDVFLFDGDKLVDTIDKENDMIIFEGNFGVLWGYDTISFKNFFERAMNLVYKSIVSDIKYMKENLKEDFEKNVVAENMFLSDVGVINKIEDNIENKFRNYDIFYHSFTSKTLPHFSELEKPEENYIYLITDDISFKNLSKYNNICYILYFTSNIDEEKKAPPFFKRNMNSVAFAYPLYKIPNKYKKRLQEYLINLIKKKYNTKIVIDLKDTE